MSHRLIAAVLLGCVLPTPAAVSQEPERSVALSGNLALTTDYVFRGLSQTWGEPAIQGGLEGTLEHGLYAGVWGSNISGKSYSGGSLELDLYGGWKGELGGFGLQLGAVGYLYPGTDFDFDTVELVAGLSRWGAEIKGSWSATDYFGLDRTLGYRDGSDGTLYLEVNYGRAFDWGLTLGLHAGWSDLPSDLAAPLLSGATDPDYEDFAAELGWDFAGPLAIAGAWTHATNGEFYDRTASFRDATDLIDPGEDRFVLTLSYIR